VGPITIIKARIELIKMWSETVIIQNQQIKELINQFFKLGPLSR